MCIALDKTADWPWAVFSDQELWELMGADVGSSSAGMASAVPLPYSMGMLFAPIPVGYLCYTESSIS
jgi:hypothetical protein